MRHYVCSVYDRKAEAFTPLFLAATKGVAIRSFVDTCRQTDHPFGLHAEDYYLACLGEWDDSTGGYVQYEQPDNLAEAKYMNEET